MFIVGIVFVVVPSARNSIPSEGGLYFGIGLIVLSVLFFLWWFLSLRFLKEPVHSEFFNRYPNRHTRANFGMLPLDQVIVDPPSTVFPLLGQQGVMY